MSIVITGPELGVGAAITTGTLANRIASASTTRIVSPPPESLVNAVDLTSPASEERAAGEHVGDPDFGDAAILAMGQRDRHA